MKVRKAISPVIATLLLILIAVAASILVYVWVTGYVSSATSGAEAPQLQERIKIDAVNISKNGDQVNVTIYVRNIGNVAVNVTSGYIINATASDVVGSNTTANLVLNPGDVGELEVTINGTLSSGTYIAKVVTRNGVEATYPFTYRES